MELDEESQNVTALVTLMGLFKWKGLLMGLASAPGVFQVFIELIMAGLSYEFALVYFDDIIVFGRFFEEHLTCLDFVPRRLKDAGLKLMAQNACIFRKKFISWDPLYQIKE